MKPALLLIFGGLSLPLALPAASFTVTNTSNSGPGSLRQTILDNNSTPGGTNLIQFNIPGAGVQTIAPLSALPAISVPVVIDGATQPGYSGTPLIEVAGTGAGVGVDGLKLLASNCVVRALAINYFGGNGINILSNGNSRVESCYLGLATDGLTARSNSLNGIHLTNSPNNVLSSNVISASAQSGVRISGASASNNIVRGNYIGIDASGTNVVAGQFTGVTIDASASRNTIGGTTAATRNVISGNSFRGVTLASAFQNVVLGNFIGTDASGTRGLPNLMGLTMGASSFNVIGGTTPGAGNVISSNLQIGVMLIGSGASNQILGNKIGTDVTGLLPLGNSIGISALSASDLVVGGTAPGAGNIIAFNRSGGVSILGSMTSRDSIRGNSIFSNTLLGIDLNPGTPGVTLNDAGDGDTGPNRLQNFPVLTGVTNLPGGTVIHGSLNSAAGTLFVIDFYANAACDGSGYGEGEMYLGTTEVFTDDINVPFEILVPLLPSSHQVVTATATDSSGNTSEFSPCMSAVFVGPRVITVVNTNDSGPGSLRQAILENNATVGGTNLIQFNIPGAGVQTIAPRTELPAITMPVVIDGFTQPGATANTLINGNNAALKIRLDGSAVSNIFAGLIISAGGSTVRGLVVVNFKVGDIIGIVLQYGIGSVVEGCFVGIDADGLTTAPNARGIELGSPFGIYSGTPPTSCRIGGDTLAARNLISGNRYQGLQIGFTSSNRIEGNYIGTDASGMLARSNGAAGIYAASVHYSSIGGTNPLQRNVISANGADYYNHGIYFAQCNSNSVLGNYVGVNALGTAALGNVGDGFWGSGSGNIIGGTTPGAGNVFSGNQNNGMWLFADAHAAGNIIQGNRIGTSADGMTAIGNGSFGVMLFDTGTSLGGAGAGNQISGNRGGGIYISSGATANRVQGNLIGTDATGLGALGNSGNGVQIYSAAQNLLGGTNTDDGNVVAFNSFQGIIIFSDTGNAILRNSIHSNGGLGIDLRGVVETGDLTPNDPGDADTGGNDAQNFPVLSAFRTLTNVTVLGTLNSRANSAYRLDFYSNTACDPSGYGEGRTWLTTTNIITDGSGNATFNLLFSPLLSGFFTAIATDTNGNTSEFSACTPILPFSADVAVSIYETADPVNVGAAFSYVVEVTNRGPADATGVVLTNFLPPEVNFVSVTSSQGSCVMADGVVTCDLGSLAALSMATVTINVTAPAPGAAFMSVKTRANETDNNLVNNSDYEFTYIGFTELVFTRSLSTNFIVAGQPFTILLTASNAGPNAATGVYIYYSPDSSFVLVSAELSQGSFEPGGIYAHLGTILVGSTATLTLHFMPTDAGTAYEYGYSYGSEHDPNSGNNYLSGSILIHEGPGVFEFSEPRFTVLEHGGPAAITVSRLGGGIGTVSVNYTAADLTATAGSDYDAASGTLIFTNGETTKMFTVPVHEDAISECNEGVRLMLFSPTGGAVLVRNTNATLLIFDDDITFAGALEAVSVTNNTPPRVGDDYSYDAVISADGSSVAFTSYAQTLVTNDHNNYLSDVFLRDVTNRTTHLISANTNGVSANNDSDEARISADGRFVAFASSATDLVNIGTNAMRNIFLRDVAARATVLVSVNTNGASRSDDDLYRPRMTPDGRFIVFSGEARNLVTNEINGYRNNIFLRDMSDSVVELISVNIAGSRSANSDSYGGTVSDDGRYVAFQSGATDLNAAVLSHGPAGSDDSGNDDIYVRDRLNGTNILCSVATNDFTGANSGVDSDPIISANARVVVFTSYASNLAPGDTNGVKDVFAYDIVSRKVHLVSMNFAGTGSGNGRSFDAVVNADGRYVVFESYATDLVPGGGGQFRDLFVRDLLAGTTTLASGNCHGTGGGNDDSGPANISADGRFVTFESYASDLTPGDFTAGRVNIFRRDLLPGTTMLVSFDHNLDSAGNHGSYYPTISADGRSIAFESEASNLMANDDNDTSDIFLWRAPAAGPSGTNATIASLRITSGQPTLTVSGSPGTLYLLQRTTSLMPPVSWTPLGTTNAPASGLFEFIDPAPLPGSAFYRVARP